MLTIYTQPNCQQCRMTKMYADKMGVPYVERVLADSPDILDKAVKAGYTSAPVVVDDAATSGAATTPPRSEVVTPPSDKKKPPKSSKTSGASSDPTHSRKEEL